MTNDVVTITLSWRQVHAWYAELRDLGARMRAEEERLKQVLTEGHRAVHALATRIRAAEALLPWPAACPACAAALDPLESQIRLINEPPACPDPDCRWRP